MDRNNDDCEAGEFDRYFDVDEMSEWLHKKANIPVEFCDILRKNFIDGLEFEDLSPEDVFKMIPVVGIAKKIIRKFPGHTDKSQPDKTSGSQSGKEPVHHDQESASQASGTSSSSHEQSSLVSSLSGRQSTSNEVIMPDLWQEDTQASIDAKVLSLESRSDISRTLVTAKYGPNPGKTKFDKVARKLILKYPFMKDDMGSGYSSWTTRMLGALRNHIKYSRRKMRSIKSTTSQEDERSRYKDLLRHYPTRINDGTSSEDAASIAEHLKGVTSEMAKEKPRDSVVLPLMRTLFSFGRAYIEHDAEDVSNILEVYPALRRPSVLEQEMNLILNKEVKASFEKQWLTAYVPAIILYGKKCRKKTITTLIKDMNELDDTSKQVTALQILIECMSGRKSVAPYIYEECENTSSPETLAKLPPVRNSPRIIAVLAEESQQYFIVIEQAILCQVPTFFQALYILFCSYYAFHLHYPPQVQSVFFFLQDYILVYPDSVNRSGNYLAIATDINRYVNTA